MIPEPTSILWRLVAAEMTEKWPSTNEDQMARLAQAWSQAGNVYVQQGQPREEPPRSVWGDGVGDQKRTMAANQRNSAKVSGERMQRLGRNTEVFGSDVQYTKESISQYVESHEVAYWFFLAIDALGGGGGRGGGGRTPARGGRGGGGGGAADALVTGLAMENDRFIQTMAARITSYGNAQDKKLPRAELPDTEPGYTRPSGEPDPNATPYGPATTIPAGADDENRRGLTRENEAAGILARQGFDVEQNPAGKPNGHNPDYLIEGKYFDAYSPSTDQLGTIRTEVEGKVSEGQVDRVVINFADTSVDPQAVRDDLRENEVPGLQEVVGIDRNGNVVPLYP